MLDDIPLVCDHLGLVTHDLERARELFTTITTFSEPGPVVEDPHQDVFVCFLTDPKIAFPRLELLQPRSSNSPVNRQMIAGGGLHHLCFQIDSLNEFSAVCRKSRLTVISQPAPAPAFGPDRRVAFIHLAGLGLVELVETENAPPLGRIKSLPARELRGSFLQAVRGVD